MAPFSVHARKKILQQKTRAINEKREKGNLGGAGKMLNSEYRKIKFLMATLVDTHAHLTWDMHRKKIETMIEEAKAEGVGTIITVGTNISDSEDCVKEAERHKNVYAVVGIYPHNTDVKNALDLQTYFKRLEKLCGKRKVVGIGECGFDFSPPSKHEKGRSIKEQEIIFKRQIELSKRVAKPLVIHSRKASKHTLGFLRKHYGSKNGTKGPFGVWHCFVDGVDIAKQALDLGFLISVTGIITYKSGADLADTVRKIPLSKILIESDSPFLTPEPARSNGVKMNENTPRYVKLVAEKVAEIKGITLQEVAEQTTKNAQKLFKI